MNVPTCFDYLQDLASALISRIAVYAIRMYGDVGGAVSDGRPYPDGLVLPQYLIDLWLFFSSLQHEDKQVYEYKSIKIKTNEKLKLRNAR